jgi:hypothetical protein
MSRRNDDIVYWCAPAHPRPLTRAQTSGWPCAMSALNYRQRGDTALWCAQRGRYKTARKITMYRVDIELSELAAGALARSPTAARAGSTALETLQRACRAIAAHEVRYVDPDKLHKAAGLARMAAWSTYISVFNRRIAAEFDRLEAATKTPMRRVGKVITTTVNQLGARL